MARMKKKEYEEALHKLQTELCYLQEWVKAKGLRIAVLFEGRDSAGKGGAIAAIQQRVSPRVFRNAALPAPTEREKTQWYFQRYVQHLPAGGEVVLFDRSWYNRAGVESVMGFASEKQVKDFLKDVPEFERSLIEDGLILFKYWLVISNEEQAKRFEDRVEDPTKQWKLSPMDLEARMRWYQYGRARDKMLEASDTKFSPWYIVDFNDQRKGRLNLIRHLLKQIPYKQLERMPVELPEREEKDAYEDLKPLKNCNWVEEKY